MSLDEIVNGNFLNLRSHLDYGPSASHKLYVVAGIPSEFTVADALRNLHPVCQSITPRYGFSNIGDGASAVFATTGISSTSLPYDIQIRIRDLGHFLDAQQHLAGKLHDVYELNVLSPPHLEAKIRFQTLFLD